MAALEDLKALVSGVASTLDEIKADIADLISKLPAEGGLTAAEVEDLKATLTGLQEKASDVADDHQVPAPEPEA